MQSPFPGMDPYLEGYLWPDVHQRLAGIISELIAPQISPKYVARINLYTISDDAPEEEIGIMYPDVEVLERRQGQASENRIIQKDTILEATPATLKIRNYESIEVRIPFVEIRDAAKNQLITAIEILSPVNKKGEGIRKYDAKRKKLIESGVHLLEIDLLRRGQRILPRRFVPESHYLVSLRRSGGSTTEVWAIDIKDPLPVLPVPLKDPDPDVLLDLGEALREVYRRGLYHLSVNYQAEQPPGPAFDAGQIAWMEELIGTIK